MLDLSWGIAGPMTTMLLADHGASVTKIEPPGGDPFRGQAGYRVWNRGKRSAILDLKSGTDHAHFLSLAETADVIVESFSPGVTERLGIDYDTLASINPRLVYCSITGYGRGTRDAGRPGYDALVQARTGLQWEQRGWPGNMYRISQQESPLGEVDIPDDALERPLADRPAFVSSRWPSLGACYQATIGISAALYVRERTGRGQWVETSLLQGAMGAAPMVWSRAENPHTPGHVGWYYDARAPRGFFECADGRWVMYAPPSPRFVRSAAAGDKLQVTDDTVKPRNDPDRFGIDQFELPVVLRLYPGLREAFRKFPAEDWVKLAVDVGVPIAPVVSPAEALADPRFLDDGCVVEVDDPELGSLRGCGVVYHLERSPGLVDRAAPLPGEHTAEVMAEAADAGERPSTKAAPATAAPARAPLEGITVLDLGTAVAGPFGTQVLSDLGAEVIRVNTLHDDFLIGHQFICAGRGKRSISVNLKEPRAQAIIHRLVTQADVVHLNIRRAAAERLGIGYQQLRELNPRLIYCHTGSYERGERSTLPGNDGVATAVTGVAWADGGCDDGGVPLWANTAVGDIGNGYLSAIAVIKALYDRERTGLGQQVDTSLAYACLLNTSYTYLRADGVEGEQHKLDKDLTGLSALYRLYQAADGWLCLAALTDEHWHNLCTALERPDLLEDSRFRTAPDRDTHDDALAGELEQAFGTRPAAEWLPLLDQAGVPAEISDPQWPLRMFDDPELTERGWVVNYQHPLLGRFDQHGQLCDFSETPGRVAGRPPMLGEHTAAILAEAGYAPNEIDELERDGVVRMWRPDA